MDWGGGSYVWWAGGRKQHAVNQEWKLNLQAHFLLEQLNISAPFSSFSGYILVTSQPRRTRLFPSPLLTLILYQTQFCSRVKISLPIHFLPVLSNRHRRYRTLQSFDGGESSTYIVAVTVDDAWVYFAVPAGWKFILWVGCGVARWGGENECYYTFIHVFVFIAFALEWKDLFSY
jgi:hypothetical protein